MVTIAKSGLYKLIMRSDKPEAKEFQNWLARVVLPAIEQDGAYIMGEEKVSSGEMSEDEFVLKALNILQSKIERLKKENELQAQTITDMKPAATVGRSYMVIAVAIKLLSTEQIKSTCSYVNRYQQLPRLQ